MRFTSQIRRKVGTMKRINKQLFSLCLILSIASSSISAFAGDSLTKEFNDSSYEISTELIQLPDGSYDLLDNSSPVECENNIPENAEQNSNSDIIPDDSCNDDSEVLNNNYELSSDGIEVIDEYNASENNIS